ncbi:MAG: TIGR04149 family rSAM-modified RiPP [Tannerella sp.]|nr:TIGR04149 family rSAM-modified RiPP [Tannerella sp.]
MKRLSKIRLSTVSDKLSDGEMKSVRGGYASNGLPDSECNSECTGNCRVDGKFGSCHINPSSWKCQCWT